MTILNLVKEMIHNHQVASVDNKSLCLAYLMLHMQNPGLHPDDHLFEEGGYEGYMVILCEEALTRDANIPASFHYPCAFLKLESTLTELYAFHDDNGEATQLGLVETLQDFILTMQPIELPTAIECLTTLYQYHKHERDTKEEESEKPAGVLKEALDVLCWIKTK